MNKKVTINPEDATEASLNCYSETPAEHDLVPRPADFDFSGDIPKYWQGEAFASRMLDALQLGFPDGERMFIHSVRNYSSEITDPVLKEQVKQFIYQEAQHGIGHTDFTKTLVDQGLPVEGVVKVIKSAMMAFKKTPRKYQLAATVAAEHMTASLGEFLLEDDNNILSNAHPAMKAFYMWHAVEEVEHKAVAWDLYESVAGGGYFTRALAMALTYPVMIGPLTLGTMAMLKADGELNIKELRKGAKTMFGKNGIWRKTFPSVMAFYKPGFHPWKTGYPESFHVWKEAYKQSGDMTTAMEAVENAS